ERAVLAPALEAHRLGAAELEGPGRCRSELDDRRLLRGDLVADIEVREFDRVGRVLAYEGDLDLVAPLHAQRAGGDLPIVGRDVELLELARGHRQIGRASCRERVEMWGGEG